jgi:hypothetical protein
VLRRTLVICLVAAAAAAPAAAQRTLLMPGVYWDREVQFTSHGPVVLNVVTAPRPGGLWGLKPLLAQDVVPGRETLTSIEKRASTAATVVGVNGGAFPDTGAPNGVLIQSGALEHTPNRGRSSIGVDSTGLLRIDRIALFATWQAAGPRRSLTGINEPPGSNGAALFTPAWGVATPAASGDVEIAITGFPSTTPSNDEIVGLIAQTARNGGTSIPPGGAVLVARGALAASLAAEAQIGGTMKIRLIVRPDWAGVVDALGGGPAIVRDGKAVFRANELFPSDVLLGRPARTAVGQKSDGTILLVTADAGGVSTGMTNFELAQALVRLGAVTASALDSGNSTSLAFDGRLLNVPAAGEQRIANALVVTYDGVYAPVPPYSVLSPNDDGVAESQSFAYKVVRPSNVTVRLIGPDGKDRLTQTLQRDPGTYPFEWNGRTSDGAAEAEGRWQWYVKAVDDRGRASSIDRSFQVNDTIGSLRAAARFVVPQTKPLQLASFSLTRTAQVNVTVETENGVVYRTLSPLHLLPGDQTVAWDGLDGRGAPVPPGTYVVRAVAVNRLGESALVSRPFVAVRK